MKYIIQTASLSDMENITQIYAQARAFMVSHGNPSQWGNNYPDKMQLLADISERKLYTLSDTHGIHGVFYFSIERDPTYEIIYDGSWHCDRPYGVIHRIAADGSGGILKAAVDFAAEKSDYLRIDTHADNLIMQNALAKLNFEVCGTIVLADGSYRTAYDRFLYNRK